MTPPYLQQCDTGRAKRDIHVHSDRFTRSADADIEEPKFEFNMESNITWENGWNESLAEEACRNTMNNDPMLIKCKDAVAGMNRVTAAGIHECMSDIMLSGHTGYMDGTLTALHHNCLVEAVRLENLTTQGPNGTSKTFFNELQELSCPKNCSGNGNCINGTCECIDGFHGDSCTLTSDTPPGIPTTGTTCLLDQNTCRNFVITGGVFLDVNLTCQVRLLKIFINRWDSDGSPVIFPARYMNDFTCICAIPDTFQTWRAAVSEEIFAEGYYLSISNDGTNFSNETTILAYDSTCYDCDTNTWNCSKLLESCDPTTDAVVITEAPIPNDTEFPPGAISGIVIGIVFFLGITTTIFIIYRSLSNNSKVHPEHESKWLQLT